MPQIIHKNLIRNLMKFSYNLFLFKLTNLTYFSNILKTTETGDAADINVSKLKQKIILVVFHNIPFSVGQFLYARMIWQRNKGRVQQI